MSRENVKCVFACVFDNTKGRVMEAQWPEDYVSAEAFDAVSEFLIPQKELCSTLLGFHASHVAALRGDRYLCFPVCCEDEKYDRNALFFSVGMVLPTACPPEMVDALGRLLRRLGTALRTMEVESSFMSSVEQRGRLGGILRSVLDALSTGFGDEVVLRLDDANMFCFKLLSEESLRMQTATRESAAEILRTASRRRRLSEDLAWQPQPPGTPGTPGPPGPPGPPDRTGPGPRSRGGARHRRQRAPVRDFDVPVLLVQKPHVDKLPLDLTAHRLVNYLDGVSYVSLIATAAEVDLGCAKATIDTLRFHGIVGLRDLYQATNQYGLGPAFAARQLARMQTLQSVEDQVAGGAAPPVGSNADSDDGRLPAPAAARRRSLARSNSQRSALLLHQRLQQRLQLRICIQLLAMFNRPRTVADAVRLLEREMSGAAQLPESIVVHCIGIGVMDGSIRRLWKHPLVRWMPGGRELARGLAEGGAEDNKGVGGMDGAARARLCLACDGTRHTDELCITFRRSWAQLGGILADLAAGGGDLRVADVVYLSKPAREAAPPVASSW